MAPWATWDYIDQYLNKGFGGDGELIHGRPLPVLDGGHASAGDAAEGGRHAQERSARHPDSIGGS